MATRRLNPSTWHVRRRADRFRRHHKLTGFVAKHADYGDAHDSIHSTLNLPLTWDDGEVTALHAEFYLLHGHFDPDIGPLPRRVRQRIVSWAKKWGPVVRFMMGG